MKVVASVILTLLMLAGCTTDSREPALLPAPGHKTWSPEQGTPERPGWPYPQPIDWAKYEPGLQQKIDEAALKKDCATIDRLFGEAIEFDGPNEEVLTYIDRWGVHIKCPRFPPPKREV